MMNPEQFFSDNQLTSMFFGGMFGALLAFGILFLLLVIAAFYIYTALAWKTIAEKRKYKKSWLAWIPVASWAMILQLGEFHWAWIFLLLIPILGWIALLVLLIIAHWRIFDKLGHPGWFSLSMIIPKVGTILYLIAIGIVAWQKKK